MGEQPAASRTPAPHGPARFAWLRDQVPPGAIGAVLVRLSNPLIAFASTLILARVLGAGAYGDYALAATTLTLLGLVAILGLDSLTPRTLGVQLQEGDLAAAARFLRWSTTAVFAAAGAAAALAAAALAWNPMHWTGTQVATTLILLVALPFAAWLRLTRSRLQAIGRTATGLAFELPVWNALLLAAGLLLLALPAWRDVRVLAALHVTGTLLAWAGAALAFRSHAPGLPRPTMGAHPAWLRTSLTFGLFSVTMFLVLGGDLFIVGTLRSPTETGQYGVVVRTAALALIVLQPLQLVAAPRLAAAWARGERAEVERVARQCMRLSLLAGFAFAAVAWIFGHWLLRFFGPGFDDALWALRWVSLAQVLVAVVGPLSIVLRMVHEERAGAAVLLGALAFGLPATIVATLLAGMEGAALARVVVLAGVAVALHVALARRTGLHVLPWRPSRHGRPGPT